MLTMVDMVEAHLQNVQRELNILGERKAAVEQEIQKLQNYLREGASVLNEAKTPAPQVEQVASKKSLF